MRRFVRWFWFESWLGDKLLAVFELVTGLEAVPAE